MKRVFESKGLCAIMFILFGLSVLATTVAGGSLPNFGSSPVLAPDIQQQQLRADGAFWPPDPYGDDDGTCQRV
jgi:hypothetical protein